VRMTEESFILLAFALCSGSGILRETKSTCDDRGKERWRNPRGTTVVRVMSLGITERIEFKQLVVGYSA